LRAGACGPALRAWSEKEGVLFVQAPVDFLAQLIAVRAHLDACTAQDGPLRTVPGTSRRRVLHFLFAPRHPPHGLRWHHAA